MRLRTATVDRYGPLADCRPPCHEGLSVVSGPNEAGKTLYLEALLRLLEPEAADVMDPPPRIEQAPTGRVVIEHGGTSYDCDGSTALSDVSAIDPRHLQSVFVVQDNDLHLPSSQEYYTSLVEKLGDIHTTEIEAVKAALKDRGRLTDSRLNISSGAAADNAGDVHEAAERLIEDIEEYVKHIEAESLDELDARRLQCKRTLQERREQLATQQQAQTVAEYERLSAHLESFRETTDQLADLAAFDRETLAELRELENDLERNRAELRDLESEIDDQEAVIASQEESLEELETKKAALERRSSAIEHTRSALETFRDREDDAPAAQRRLSLTKYATVAALLGAGGAGVAGAVTGSLPAIGVASVLLLVAIATGLGHYRSNQRVAAVQTARESVLRTARDAGLDVESVEEVAPAIGAFESEVASVDDRLTRTDQQRQNAEERLEELRQNRDELRATIDDQESSREQLLAEADVASIDEYEQRVKTREDLTPDRQTAKQALVDRFGEPETSGPEAMAAAWEQDLEALVADVDLDAHETDAYDEQRHHELAEAVDRLEGRLDDLQESLDEHDRQLEAFDRRGRDLAVGPFVDDTLALASRSKAGLESLAADAKAVVDQIEADADLSRKAIQVFERIEAEEEQKLTDLFDPDGPASRTFEQVTGGRYTAVGYDAERHEIVVDRHDGRTFPSDVLSQGTKDQLYFASRVSLAQQLLGNEAGFLLLDDPFLAADPERLRRGFESLQILAEDGWQILYLTAKQEVSERMVEEFALDHSRMGLSSSGMDSPAKREPS